MKEFNCIVCPRGCLLKVEKESDGFKVEGNTCRRGYDFAISEMTDPKRTICSTVKTVFPEAPVLPVRVSEDIPKDRIFDVMREIHSVTVSKPVGRGAVIIPDVLCLGADVISTSNVLLELQGSSREVK